ncbi:MAG: hypothetical protein SFT92_07640 [Rickettsiales bacterium]|nr:hypothetical protein [Rickettsiales bacterium]
MSRVRYLIALSAALIANGCSTHKGLEYPPPSFRQYQPIHMAVSSIEFVEEYKSPMRDPYVEHLMPFSPADAMRIWVRDRMHAVGGEKTMRIIIKEGSVKEKSSSNPLTMMNVFGNSSDSKYEAKLEVELRIYGESPIAESTVTVNALRKAETRERDSAASRDEAYKRMITELMNTANAELEKSIYQSLSSYISYSQNP